MARRPRAARLTEATATVAARDFVSWQSSSGMAKGRVKSVHTGKVPAIPTSVSGTAVAPAARVELYAEVEGGGWKGTGQYLGMSTTALTPIDALPEPTTEAVVSGSFDDLRRRVQAAIEDQLEAAADAVGLDIEPYVWVCDMGADWAVYTSGYDDDTFRVPYSVAADGSITLGTAAEVQQVTTYEPVGDQAAEEPTAEPAAEAVRRRDTLPGRVVEAKGTDDTGGRIFNVRIIAVGDSKNGRRYPAATLQEAVALYEGAKAYDHHRTDEELKSSTINGLVGSYRNVESRSDGLYGDLHLLPSATHTAEALDATLAAQDAGLPPLVGISHDVMAAYRPVVEGGRRLMEATQIVSVNSADVVADPAAGGLATRMVAGGIDTEKEKEMTLEELLALLQSATPQQLVAAGVTAAAASAPEGEPTTESTVQRDGMMGKLLITQAIAAAGMPERAAEAVTGLLPEHFTEAQLTAQVTGVKELLAGFERAGLAPSVPAVEVTQEAQDKKVERLDAMFASDYSKGYRSLKEAYIDITGARPKDLFGEDFNRQILRESLGEGYDTRSLESVQSGTWSTILGDSVTRRMVAEYNQPSLSFWREIVSSIVPVMDFRTQRVERMGGYGTLPGVNQGAPYQALTTPTNEEVTYAISKRGGTEDLTLETIANDDLRAVQRIPVKLGLAAAQTLFRFVFDILATNPNVYDSAALFAAGHNNADAGNTLSQTNLSTGRRRMRQQTAYGDSTDLLSIIPKYLVVPSALEELAFQLCTSAVAIPATPAGPTNTPNIHQGLTPLVLDYYSAASTWFLVGDPNLVPTIELGFYQGRQDPDLFVQSDPQTGSVFAADKITYKIRHIYSGAVLDYRGFYRGN